MTRAPVPTVGTCKQHTCTIQHCAPHEVTSHHDGGWARRAKKLACAAKMQVSLRLRE
jgi:hypothetical protein